MRYDNVDEVFELHLSRSQRPTSFSAQHPDGWGVDAPDMPLVEAVTDSGAALALAVQIQHPKG